MLFRSGLLELLSSLGLVSKIVLLILLIFSIGSWTVILYKWRFFRRQEAADLRFLKTYPRNESPPAASPALHPHPDSSAAAGLAEVARGLQPRRSRRVWPRLWWRRPPGCSRPFRRSSRTIIF